MKIHYLSRNKEVDQSIFLTRTAKNQRDLSISGPSIESYKIPQFIITDCTNPKVCSDLINFAILDQVNES